MLVWRIQINLTRRPLSLQFFLVVHCSKRTIEQHTGCLPVQFVKSVSRSLPRAQITDVRESLLPAYNFSHHLLNGPETQKHKETFSSLRRSGLRQKRTLHASNVRRMEECAEVNEPSKDKFRFSLDKALDKAKQKKTWKTRNTRFCFTVQMRRLCLWKALRWNKCFCKSSPMHL